VRRPPGSPRKFGGVGIDRKSPRPYPVGQSSSKAHVVVSLAANRRELGSGARADKSCEVGAVCSQLAAKVIHGRLQRAIFSDGRRPAFSSAQY
jgi:hypothetical protein